MRITDIYEEKKVKLNSPEFKKLLTPGLKKLDALYKENDKDLRIVGGAVRDIIIGKEPKDIDLASDATPYESLRMLERAGIRVIETGIEHGTITAVVDGEDYEITTLRIDTETTGRHATVEYTKDWRVDAERRDLTFNAMSLELDGTLYDYFGGIEDLKAGRAKFVGDADERIKEDFLRILRYFRFQGRTRKPQWDNETLSVIKRNVDGLNQISGERIWMEMGKILEGNFSKEILEKMKLTGVDNVIGLSLDRISQFKQVKNNLNDKKLLLASLIHDISELSRIDMRWKFNKNERELIQFIINNRDNDLTIKDAKTMYVNPKIPQQWVRALAQYQGKINISNDLKNWTIPVFPVTGQHLLSYGMKPGPDFGKTLMALKKQWIDSDYQLNKDELLQGLEQ